MVLPVKVGRERSFWTFVLLQVATFGIYGLVWHYKAHHEVYRQFELDREGRDQGMVWFILGIVLFQPLMWVYQHRFVSNVNYVGERLWLRRRITPGGFLGFTIPAGILHAVGMLLLIVGIQFLAAQEGDVLGKGVVLSGENAEGLHRIGAVLAPLGGGLLLAGLALALVAYARLQATLNDVWRAYDQRAAQLTAPPAQPPPGAPAFADWRPVGAPTPPR